jgi:PTS hybrid protein
MTVGPVTVGPMTVGLVIVSHSARLADGVVELAGQMAPDVPMVAAGGAADGGLGTDYAAVCAALRRADQGGGVIVLYDLGSAVLTAELAVESLAEPGRVRVVDAPLVEGAVAAAVAAAGGGDLNAVRDAAVSGAHPTESPATRPAPETQPTHEIEPTREIEIVLTNDIGLHARPAALLARAVAGLAAEVTVAFGDRRADAGSVLGLLALAAGPGDVIRVSARGGQAAEALSRVRNLAERGFAE